MRPVIWILIVLGLVADSILGNFAYSFVTDVSNPLRYEAQEGMALVTVYCSFAWLIAPLAAFARRDLTKPVERTLSLVPLGIATAIHVITAIAA